MKKLLLVIAGLLMLCSLSAQTREDILYLKNGSVIRGKIVEDSENRVRIEGSDGNILAYDKADIERYETIVREPFFDFKTEPEKRWSFGPSAGYLYSSALWMNRDGEGSGLKSVRTKGKHGFSVGGVAEYRFWRGFGVEGGIKFSMGGFSYPDNNSAAGMDFTRYSLDVPIVANFYLGKSRQWFFQAGINASIFLFGDVEVGSWWDTIQQRTTGYIMNPLSLSAIIGGGYGPISLQAAFGLTSLWTGDFRSDIADRLINRVVSYSGNMSFLLSYTYKF